MDDSRDSTDSVFSIWKLLPIAISAMVLIGVSVLTVRAARQENLGAEAGPPPVQIDASVTPMEELPVMGTVPAFSLTERSGKTVTLASLRGKVWIADFIFTYCASTCPIMTMRMYEIQEMLPEGNDVHLVTFTVDPKRDTEEKLAKYADRYEADQERWWFLTGEEEVIHGLCRDGFKLSVGPTPPEDAADPIDVTHSTRFALVDAQGRIRGYYDGLDANSVLQLQSDIGQLMRQDSN